MHRASFSNAAYATGGRSPYQAYSNPLDREQVHDFVDYIPEDYTLLTPSQSRIIEDENEPDRVHITYRGETWKVDFPPFSIAEEKVQVIHVRERVAGRLGVDTSRIRLLYKGKEMKVDDAPLRLYGCKQNSEITVVISSQPHDHDSRRHHHHSGSDSDSVNASNRAPRYDEAQVARSGSTYRRRESDGRQTNGYLHPTHHSTPTSGATSPRQTSPVRQAAHSPTRTTTHSRNSPPAQTTHRNTSPRPSPTQSPRNSAPAVIQPSDPSTPVGKIQQLRYEFHTTWVPRIDEFVRSPPSNKEDRDKEYLRLNEIVSQKVFDRGDAIETEGSEKEEMRAIRKTLYAEANDIQKYLDRFKPKDTH